MQIKPWVRAACVALAASALFPAAAHAGTWCSSGKTVHFAGVTWESGSFTSEVLRYIAEKGYGCKTDTVPGSTAATETALARDDLQVWGGQVKLIGDTLPGGTNEGWYVPEYVIKGDPARGIKPLAPNLTSVTDLPKYKDIFEDDEEPGKGRFLNCPAGWDCERVNSRLLKVLKLDDSYTNFRPGTGAALDAAITSAYQRGKPILFYYWEPAALMAKYKFVQLKMPPFDQKCWETLRADNSTSQCASSYLVSHLKVGVSTPFYQAEPEQDHPRDDQQEDRRSDDGQAVPPRSSGNVEAVGFERRCPESPGLARRRLICDDVTTPCAERMAHYAVHSGASEV